MHTGAQIKAQIIRWRRIAENVNEKSALFDTKTRGSVARNEEEVKAKKQKVGQYVEQYVVGFLREQPGQQTWASEVKDAVRDKFMTMGLRFPAGNWGRYTKDIPGLKKSKEGNKPLWKLVE